MTARRGVAAAACLWLCASCGCAVERSARAPVADGARRSAAAERYCQARGLATTGTILLSVGITALVAHGALAAGHSVDLLKGDATGIVYHSAGAGAGLALLTAGAVDLSLAQARAADARREVRPARCPP